jgi:MoxR-like ATPase
VGGVCRIVENPGTRFSFEAILDTLGTDHIDEDASRRSKSELQSIATELLDNTSSVVLGKRDVARLCLVALLAGEHVLLEDVPGVGKTLMAKAIAKSVGNSFSRIQFTPDLLPSDILGSSVFKADAGEFVFNRGAIFSSFVLADEINRAPPRTQSALLEAMSDNQVSVDGTTHELPRPFMVIATQNPFEFEGTYVLPESQLDRFLLRLSMGYPDREFESQILASHKLGEPVDELGSVCDGETLLAIQKAVKDVSVEESIGQYMMNIVHTTRESPEFNVGVSTRGVLAWHRAVQAMAFLDSRDYALPDDAKSLAVHVLSHRTQLRGGQQGARRDESDAAILEVVGQHSLPT